MARPRSEDARRRAIEGAVDALTAVGVDGATIEEIAQRSGVAKSTLYRHFGCREELLSQAVRSLIVEAPTPNTGSLSDDLEIVFGRYDETAENRRLNELFPMLLDAARRDGTMQATVDLMLSERQRPLRTVIELAQARGEVDPDLDLDDAMAMLVGPLTYRRMIQRDGIDSDFLHLVRRSGIAALQSTAR